MRVIQIDPKTKTVVCEKIVNDNYVIQSNEIESQTGFLGQVQQDDGTFINPPPTLGDVKNQKITELTNAEQQASSTFQSSALGSVHTYLSDEKAMAKFNADYAYVNSAEYDGQPILWFTLEEGGVKHTKEQFNQVWTDGRNFIAANFAKWDSLVKQVKACTTVDEVNAIKW
jgi:hypothetical protein